MTPPTINAPSLEDEIALLKQKLAHAQQHAALGELVGTTTHEFNNVLTTIINYAKIGLRHKDEATRDKALNRILSAGQRAARITGSVLAMARNRSNSIEPTDLASLVDESLVLLEREMNKYRIAVEREFEKVPPVLANGNQIQQVLLNLLINARQAMPSGGRVILRLSCPPPHDMVDFVVRDTGCGIPADRLPRIFDPYFSTKSGPDATGKGGTGLGLSSCRETIEAHRGRIRVESTPGKGTAFTIRLPVAPSRQTAGQAVTSPTQTAAPASKAASTQHAAQSRKAAPIVTSASPGSPVQPMAR
jgi:signal transduction histidine kinase